MRKSVQKIVEDGITSSNGTQGHKSNFVMEQTLGFPYCYLSHFISEETVKVIND